MPAARISLRRRRSSLALSFQPAKAGIYGISRPVTFAPNVTPISYNDDSSSPSTPEPSSPTASNAAATIFPPSEVPAPPPARRRCPPGKRRSLGYIPRPPNAFMLFRADFVRQKHVPGTIETNHGSLSKIIGNCWRALPLEEKKIWEVKAKHAKAEHKVLYPEYRFKPVHNKNKNKEKKEKQPTTVEDERRCEEVAQLLLEGKKGDELAAAVRNLDLMRVASPIAPPQIPSSLASHHQQQFSQRAHRSRRPSSVPLPNEYYPQYPFMTPTLTLPTAPFLTASFASTNISPNSAAQFQYPYNRPSGSLRRPSSAQPYIPRSWTFPGVGLDIAGPTSLQHLGEPLPEVDNSLWDPSFLQSTFPMFDNRSTSLASASSLPSMAEVPPLSPHEFPSNPFPVSDIPVDPLAWLPAEVQHVFEQHSSAPSSTYSPSPPPFINVKLANDPTAPSRFPVEDTGIIAPKPQSATTPTFGDLDAWSKAQNMGVASMFEGIGGDMTGMDLSAQQHAGFQPKSSFDVAMQALGAFDTGLGVGMDTMHMDGFGGMEMQFDPASMSVVF